MEVSHQEMHTLGKLSSSLSPRGIVPLQGWMRKTMPCVVFIALLPLACFIPV